MKKYSSSLIGAAVLCGFVLSLHAQQKVQDERLVSLWETKPDLRTTESVAYDSANEVLYVSNINTNPWVKDGNGFISKVNLGGDIVATQWIKGLSAPKGLGVFKGRLFVTDIDELVEIDIAKGEIARRHKVEGAQKLNDVTVDASGTVYFSDMGDSAIYQLKNGKVELFLKSDELKNINGVYAQGNTLFAGLADRAVVIDLATKAVKTYADKTGRIDGIVPTGTGTFLISDWSGHVFEIQEGQPPHLLLDTTPLQINAADIEYIKEKDLLLVPTFFKDSVVAYRLKFSK
jgi:sugar lactone lactonase YvrE